jgi:hypothetical protein
MKKYYTQNVNHPWRCLPYSVQPHLIKFVSDLRQVSGFLVLLQFPLPIKNWLPQYNPFNYNMVENGVKQL